MSSSWKSHQQEGRPTNGFTRRHLPALFILLLIGALNAAITIQSPSPANNSVVIGSTATFNWTSTTLLCLGTNFTIARNGAQFSRQDFPSLLTCNGTVVLSNLTTGAYNWSVANTRLLGDENSTSWLFNVTPQINTSLIYPPSGSTYGPGQCWIVAQVRTNDSDSVGATRSSSCRLYAWDGSAYALNQTLSSSSTNADYNFSIAISNTSLYAINCTATVSGYTNTTATSSISIIGQSFCAGGQDDPVPSAAFIACMFLGGGLLLLGIWWSR